MRWIKKTHLPSVCRPSQCLPDMMKYLAGEVLKQVTHDNLKNGCHTEPVEVWRAGLCTRVFDRLRLTGPLCHLTFRVQGI